MSYEVYLSADKIQSRIKELGAEISKDFAGQELVIVGVLSGSFMFLADLVREIKGVDVKLEFMSVSSYEGTHSSGNVKINLDLNRDVSDCNVLLVEDIVDTGLTIVNLMDVFSQRKVDSLKLCSLLHKPARQEHPVHIDYLGFTIEDKFVIGYGLDFDGRYRELPYIGIYSEN